MSRAWTGALIVCVLMSAGVLRGDVASSEGLAPTVYLLGKGISTATDPQDRVREAREDARADLVKSIRTVVQSEYLRRKEEIGERFESVAVSQTVSTASMEIAGVQYRLRDEGKTTYALAYVDREEAKRLHYEIADRTAQEISAALENARRLAHAGRRDEALRAYAAIYPLLARLDDALAVLLVVHGEPPTVPVASSTVDAEIDQVENAAPTSLADAAALLVRRLDRCAPMGSAVLVQTPVYSSASFSSPFASHFRRLIEVALGPRAVPMTTSFQARGVDTRRDAARQSSARVLLRSAYVESGEDIEIIGFADRVETAERVGSARVVLPRALAVEANLDTRPQNFAEALADSHEIGDAELEVVSGALRLELWTNRGADGLAFEEGDVYKLYVRTNRPCTVRLLYHLADGTRVVMFEDYTIPATMANRVVEIPERYSVSAPFGVERVQGFAYVKTPPPIKTRRQLIAGVSYDVLDESLGSAMARYRGFVRQGDVDDNTTTSLTLTTIRREGGTPR
ncbi:DUF4384 domain-containing protein [Candidatus Poribacteria bacterium]|nr:DUF4384 domain-containing protein [Candidatus Poribacteria bacterium]